MFQQANELSVAFVNKLIQSQFEKSGNISQYKIMTV